MNNQNPEPLAETDEQFRKTWPSANMCCVVYPHDMGESLICQRAVGHSGAHWAKGEHCEYSWPVNPMGYSDVVLKQRIDAAEATAEPKVSTPLPQQDTKIWFCKIGEVQKWMLPEGSDMPMREAIGAAYKQVTGVDPDFIFSGWAGELTEGERAVVEDKCPKCNKPHRNMEDSEACRNSTPAALPQQGVGSFFGNWPGDETDEQLLKQLEEIRKPDLPQQEEPATLTYADGYRQGREDEALDARNYPVGGDENIDTHKLGTCLRFANGETCIGCGDDKNGDSVNTSTAPLLGQDEPIPEEPTRYWFEKQIPKLKAELTQALTSLAEAQKRIEELETFNLAACETVQKLEKELGL